MGCDHEATGLAKGGGGSGVGESGGGCVGDDRGRLADPWKPLRLLEGRLGRGRQGRGRSRH